MNRIFATWILLFLTIPCVLANPEKKVKSEIKNVTVFLNRAQINSFSSTTIEAGYTDIVVEGLPSGIIQNSVQVTGKGDFIIMAVKYNADYVNPAKKPAEVIVLEDSLEFYQDKLDLMNVTKTVLAKEENLLLANQVMGGKEKSLDPDELEYMADFFRERLSDIHTKLAKNEKQIKKVNEKIKAIQHQIRLVQGSAKKASSHLVVTVSSKARTTAQLDLQYIITDAGWYPVYDLRAKDTRNPVQLQYKAQVYQNSGTDWDKVKIKLSTANPSLSGTKPILETWWLDIFDPQVVAPLKDKKRMAPSYADEMVLEERSMALSKSESIASHTTVTETTLAAEFDIAVPYSIPSNGVGQLVDIQNYELPATYKHYAVPKLDPDVFLTARVTGWDNLSLLSGKANIYFEGTYVGEAFIDMNQSSDTLELSMGRDKHVLVERKRVTDFSSRSFFGNNKKEEHAFDIIIRNSKRETLDIVIEDQVPLSKNSQLEVVLIESSGAGYTKESGKIEWKLKINPVENRTVKLKYSVKYPKGKQLTGGFW